MSLFEDIFGLPKRSRRIPVRRPLVLETRRDMFIIGPTIWTSNKSEPLVPQRTRVVATKLEEV